MPQIMTEQQRSRAFLGLGGNLGEPLDSFCLARQALARDPQIEVLGSSPLYRTPPLGGPPDQPDYFNAVLELSTSLSAKDLLRFCQGLEALAGRERTIPWGPRTLDIDLLLFDQLILQTEELQLPHPRIKERHFVLLPLADLAAELIHPQLKQSIGDLLRRLPPAAGIRKLQDTW